jgi:hypothetical protein
VKMTCRTKPVLRTLAVLAVALGASNALAKQTRSGIAVVDVGDPIEGGSWHQNFRASSFYRTPFDHVIGVMDSHGAGFELPGMTFGSSSSWSSNTYSENLIVAEGHAGRSLDWRSNFNGDLDDTRPFGIDLFLTSGAGDNSFLVGKTRAYWTGGLDGEWIFFNKTVHNWDTVNAMVDGVSSVRPVPIPAAAPLAVLGMGLLGGFRSLRSRRLALAA